MYNRYIPNGTSYTRVVEQEHLSPPPKAAPVSDAAFVPPPRQTPPPSSPLSSLLSGLGGRKKNAGLAGIFEKFKLDDIDTGDILLILILLFLFRDGDDMELVLTLGLLLLLGLEDDKAKEDQIL